MANWLASKQDEGALLRGALLTEAEPWLKTRAGDLSEHEQRFITASRALADREVQEREAARQRELDLERRRAEAERQRAETQLQATQQLRRRAVWLGIALFVAVVVAGVALYFYDVAEKTSLREVEARQIAEANTELANQQLARLEGLRLYQEAEQLKAAGQVTEAIAAYTQADAADATLKINLTEQEEDVRSQAAILLVQAGEELARNGDLIGAAEKYQAALDLKPPPDTPVYVRVPAGEFTMGSTGTEQYSDDNEKPQHQVMLDEFWILRTEVTNGQYKACVEDQGCEPPSNSYWNKEALARWPVTHVDWQQASQYAAWKGGRLPTEAEWEKACRGTEPHIYPWGDELPTRELANFNYNEDTVTDVGNYLDGQSPYGLLDMAGNVWEWTSSPYQDYPYQPDAARTLRGGAFYVYVDDVRCANRYFINPTYTDYSVGFRFLAPGF